MLAGADPPAAAAPEQQLARWLDLALVRSPTRRGSPMLAGNRRVGVHRAGHDGRVRVTQPGRQAGARLEPLVGRDEGAVAGMELEPDLDGLDEERSHGDEAQARSGGHRSSPGQTRSPHVASAARRRSRRSGSRRGTSRRSTMTPATPPETGTLNLRARRPMRAESRNSRVAVARLPGPSGTSASSPVASSRRRASSPPAP